MEPKLGIPLDEHEAALALTASEAVSITAHTPATIFFFIF